MWLFSLTPSNNSSSRRSLNSSDRRGGPVHFDHRSKLPTSLFEKWMDVEKKFSFLEVIAVLGQRLKHGATNTGNTVQLLVRKNLYSLQRKVSFVVRHRVTSFTRSTKFGLIFLRVIWFNIFKPNYHKIEPNPSQQAMDKNNF